MATQGVCLYAITFRALDGRRKSIQFVGRYKEASTKLQVVGLHERPHRQGQKNKMVSEKT